MKTILIHVDELDDVTIQNYLVFLGWKFTTYTEIGITPERGGDDEGQPEIKRWFYNSHGNWLIGDDATDALACHLRQQCLSEKLRILQYLLERSS